MDSKKYDVFWRLYNMQIIPRSEFDSGDIKKDAFMEYVDIREDMIQQAREVYASEEINATVVEIEDMVQADMDDGLIDEAVAEELYDRYPDLEEYFEKLIIGEVHTTIAGKQKR